MIQSFDKALEDAQHSLIINPTSSDAFAAQALAYEGKQNFDKALDSVNQGLKLGETKKLK